MKPTATVDTPWRQQVCSSWSPGPSYPVPPNSLPSICLVTFCCEKKQDLLKMIEKSKKIFSQMVGFDGDQSHGTK